MLVLCNFDMNGMNLGQTEGHSPFHMHAGQVHTFQLQWDFSLCS